MYNVYNRLEQLVATVSTREEAVKEAERIDGFYENVRFETVERIMDSFDYERIGFEKMYIKNGIYIFINHLCIRVWENSSIDDMANIPYDCRNIKSLYKIISQLERLKLSGFIGPEEDL